MYVLSDGLGWDDVGCVLVEYVCEDVTACRGDWCCNSDMGGCCGAKFCVVVCCGERLDGSSALAVGGGVNRWWWLDVYLFRLVGDCADGVAVIWDG